MREQADCWQQHWDENRLHFSGTLLFFGLMCSADFRWFELAYQDSELTMCECYVEIMLEQCCTVSVVVIGIFIPNR